MKLLVNFLIGVKPTPSTTLEMQAKNTRFKTTHCEQTLDFNEWCKYIYSQLNSKAIGPGVQ